MAPKYTCPCCGYKTLGEPPPGTFEICPVCFWEDDSVDSDFARGANALSLRQAQANFQQLGACEDRFKSKVREPTVDELKDASWRPL
jgi:hypothetical protein